MKILPLVNNIKTDITASSCRLKYAAASGYSVASRAAKIYKQNNLRMYLNVTRSVGDKIIKCTTVNELPYLGGALGMIIPLPLASPFLMGVGIAVKYFTNGISKLNDKINFTKQKSRNLL